jgi:hypothetical protein
MMIYQDAKSILAEVEARIISISTPERPSVKPLWRETGGPLKFTLYGLGEFFRHGRKYYCWQFVMMAVCGLTWSLLTDEMRGSFTLPLTLSFLLAPLFFTVFSVPSTYAHAGITVQEVESACTAICFRGIRSTNALDAFKAVIELLEQPVKKRVSRLQLVVAGLWSFWGYWLWSLLVPKSESALRIGGVAEFVSYSVALLIIFLLVQGYSKAHTKLYSIIHIAINEQRVPGQEVQQQLLGDKLSSNLDATSRYDNANFHLNGRSSSEVM